MKQPSYVGFKSKEYHWKPNIDYRENPHLYKVGRGQQGVLICQPYKSELHIHWRFKTPEQAKQSAQTIYMMFLDYLKNVERFFRSSNIFKDYWKLARENEDYRKMKKEFMCR